MLRSLAPIEDGATLKNKVHRIGVAGAFSARRASAATSSALQRVGQPRDDFVLHVEEIGERLVEPLGPEMIAVLGVDQLHVDAHAVAAALNAAFQHVADVQLAPDLLQVDRLALVGERRVAGDDEGAARCAKGRWSGSP